MDERQEVNDWAAIAGVTVSVLILGFLVYTVLPPRTLQWLVSVASFGLILFVIYLLYRFVIAVEKIAAKL